MELVHDDGRVSQQLWLPRIASASCRLPAHFA
jgi:hypothetical protein